jgi:hypothetical protein
MLELAVEIVRLAQAAYRAVAPPVPVDDTSHEQLARVRVDDHLIILALAYGEELELNPDHLPEPHERVRQVLQQMDADDRVEGAILEGHLAYAAHMQPGIYAGDAEDAGEQDQEVFGHHDPR